MPKHSAASGEITAETVKHLAGLARIAVSDEEVASLTSELASIVRSIAKVSEVTHPGVPATSHPIPLANVTRMDEVADVLTREEALSGAPDEIDGRFRVSAILGEEQ
jgi:aspartyl-tRNA(Asn)/glutamyl-tRNA(Gln) amidotransferase subunit C